MALLRDDQVTLNPSGGGGMDAWTKAIAIAGLAMSSFDASAQVIVRDLVDGMAAGTVTLESPSGTGASSGSSLEAVLTNRTARDVHLDVYLAEPLFFANRGAGQNMVALAVYHGDGGYRSDGTRSFITLPGGKSSKVVFIAYCADFEKENPTPQDTFDLEQAPVDLIEVTERITAYSKANPDRDITAAAQVAIWLQRGHSAEEIAEKFRFTASDEQLAKELLK